MRSILLIFATIVLVAIGFFAYLWFQPREQQGQQRPGGGGDCACDAGRRKRPIPTVLMAAGPAKKSGSRPTTNTPASSRRNFAPIISSREKMARWMSPSRTESFIWGPNPATRAAGQVMEIHGKTGQVVLPDSANNQKNGQTKGSNAAAPIAGSCRMSRFIFTTTRPPPSQR